jgi:carbon monoxide dehydrogenase subunit G
MLLENSFEVPAPIDRVWSYLLDVEKVAVCMPGAELTDAIDEKNYKGKVKLRLGPVSLAFSGKVTVAERDDAAHRVVLQGSGMEQRGKGRATVSVTTTAEETADGTKVVVVQDLQVQGQIASMSRGMMNDVSARLTQQFADCLQKNLGVKEEEEAATAPPERAAAEAASAAGARIEPARPAATGGEVKGFSLLLSALAGSLRRLLGRLMGRARNR